MHVIKFVIIIPVYLFLVLGGFIGWGTNKKDKWDDLVEWARK